MAKGMQAQRSIAAPLEHVWKVSAWKWGIDRGSPRWKHAFFKWVFLPFLSFSFKLGIPTPKEAVEEIDEQGHVCRRIFRWFEDEGFFGCKDQADAACLEEHWGYTRIPYGKLLTPESGQVSGTIFPRKRKGSRKWAKPQSTFIIKDRRQEEQQQRAFADYLEQLHRVLDQ